jgi:uncharacterized protein YaiE (UPF0345 family)
MVSTLFICHNKLFISKNNMKKALQIFFLFITMLSTISCGETWRITHNQTHDEYTIGTMYARVFQYSTRQVDSMCVVDGLPRNLEDWANSSYNEYETGRRVVKMVYIKCISLQIHQQQII